MPTWFVRLTGLYSCELECCSLVWRPVENWRSNGWLFVFAFIFKPLPAAWPIRAILHWIILQGWRLGQEYGFNPRSRVSPRKYFKIDRANGRGPQRYKLRFVVGLGSFIFSKYLEMSENILKKLGISWFVSDSLEICVWWSSPVHQRRILVLEFCFCSGGWGNNSS